MTIRELPKKMFHGGDYNPDQWLDRPDILEEDIRLMKEANVNCVTLGVFAWSKLEPSEGVFDSDWLAKVMDDLYDNGIYTILATPTGAMPRWLTGKYPEVMKVNEYLQRRHHGLRHNFCPSSPKMRSAMESINTHLAKRFGNHPGLVAWHISNEYGGDFTPPNVISIGCQCDHCQNNFRTYLKNRYQTLDNLNKAWWTPFWSNIVTDWDQIEAPSLVGESAMQGLKLDWKRFVSAQMQDFCEAEIAVVRKYSDRPSVINLMGAFEPLDYFKWARSVDLVSMDSYPMWHNNEDERAVAADAAFTYDLMRSLKKQSFLLMESCVSSLNWQPRNVLKRPGMHALSSLQAVAHGSDSVQYFQWRRSRGAFEKYHGAVISHLNGGDTRVFKEVSDLGERLVNITDEVLGTCNKPKVALLFDWENMWALEGCAALTAPIDPFKRYSDYYRAFWELGVEVDIVDMEDPLEGYKVVVAPMNYMYRGNYVENVKRFVENGGVYLGTYFSGEVDDSDLCFIGEHPLAKLFGIRPEEIDVSPLYTHNHVVFDNELYPIKDLCGLIHAEGAEVLAEYEKDFYAGYPALTVNNVGLGKAFYLAAEGDWTLLKKVYELLLKEAEIGCELKALRLEGVSVTRRDHLFFVMNFNGKQVEVDFDKAYVNIENQEEVFGKVMMAPYQCLIVKNK